MQANPAHYNSEKTEPCAPVAGGMRWRRPYHDVIALCRRDRGLVVYDPDEPPEREPSPSEPGAVTAPRIVSAPPPEARAGEEYVYRARAFSADVDGFTWYLESPVPGMEVDRQTGTLTWTPPEGGRVLVVLCARSLYGAESRQSWTLCVRRARRAAAFRANARFRRALDRRRAARPRRFRAWSRPRRRNVPRGTPQAPPGARGRAATPLRI